MTGGHLGAPGASRGRSKQLGSGWVRRDEYGPLHVSPASWPGAFPATCAWPACADATPRRRCRLGGAGCRRLGSRRSAPYPCRGDRRCRRYARIPTRRPSMTRQGVTYRCADCRRADDMLDQLLHGPPCPACRGLGAGCTQAHSVTVPGGSHGIHDVMSALAEVLAAPRQVVPGPTASPFCLV